MKECNIMSVLHTHFLRMSNAILMTIHSVCRYGDLQGFNKQKTAEKYGKDQVHKWRRTYDVRPPNGESLEMCLRRAVSFFKEQVGYDSCIPFEV